MRKHGYVHGYSGREKERLFDQAGTLSDILHSDTKFPPGKRVLEAGCGVGAQTVILAKNSPRARFVSVDISEGSVDKAAAGAKRLGITNVEFMQADILDLKFEDESFDHVFVCFVLEHLKDPGKALRELKRVLRKNGTITVIEGDHGSAYFYPDSREGRKTIDCLVDLQEKDGGDALIGRALYPVLKKSGFKNIRVDPRVIYVDPSRPGLEKGFTKNTFIAMVDGVKQKAINAKMMKSKEWEKGIKDMYHTVSKGTFCYTFFKAVATK
ncbi:MAG TPA: methyltransferase domain-containing protein [Candidatus Omnitrophota bacterium]|nr:methyltransferase domain-containing protein [Candidatus Omnitrophota bacterium]